jgi:serine/threonine-protein kinase
LQILERDWPLPDCRIVDLLSQTLSALAVAHDMGIVHRDLKPENIMLLSRIDDDGHPRDLVKVCDFGIAKTADAVEDPKRPGGKALTTHGMILGTPEYMSPEQCRGEPLDSRSDLYSVGVILYQLLTGRVPFQGSNAIDVVLKHVTEEPAPPSAILPGVSPRLEALCLRALRKEPAQRYAGAREMRAELRVDVSERARDASPAPSAARVMTGASETMASAGVVSKPRRETAAPIAGDIELQTKIPSGQPSGARKGRSLRYAGAVAVMFAIVAATAMGVRRSKPSKTPPPVIVESALAKTPEPELVPFVPTASAPKPEPPPPDLRLAKSAIVSRPRLRSPTASAEIPAPPPPVALIEREARPPPLPANPAAEPPAQEVKLANQAPPQPPPPSIPPSPVRVDPSKGRVIWNVSAAGGGATTGSVAHALARAASGWQRCYQAGLGARSASVQETVTMRLSCDEQGRVISVTFPGTDMPDVAACIRASTTGATIPNADTGEAWATIALTFKVLD